MRTHLQVKEEECRGLAGKAQSGEAVRSKGLARTCLLESPALYLLLTGSHMVISEDMFDFSICVLNAATQQ